MHILQEMRGEMRAGGFNHYQTVFFPQCIYPSGWWSATMAGKNAFAAFREQDAINKGFDTVYYNHEIHKASLAMPEFSKGIRINSPSCRSSELRQQAFKLETPATCEPAAYLRHWQAYQQITNY